MTSRLCCFILNQDKLEEGCENQAEYQIWYGYKPTPDDYTESCGEHLEQMLDDSTRFEILRIEEDEHAPTSQVQPLDTDP